MSKDLTNSQIARQNVLNNPYALAEIQEAMGLQGVQFEGQLRFTKKQVAHFFEVSERTMTTLIKDNEAELKQNGYEVLTSNRLNNFYLESLRVFDREVSFPIKTRRLALFSFRTLLNVAMLLTRSEKAKQVRSLILDIVIDTINSRTGGSTKYINQRDEDFVLNLLQNGDYHRELLDALHQCVDLGKIKYIIYSDKVYTSIFKEDAKEYRKILKLEEHEYERETMYSEVLDLISSFEVGFAEALKERYRLLGRKLTEAETQEVYRCFEGQRLWQPLIHKARTKMASRDLCFRDALHQNLQEYIQAVAPEDFDRFIGERSMALEERLQDYADALRRLKERE